MYTESSGCILLAVCCSVWYPVSMPRIKKSDQAKTADVEDRDPDELAIYELGYLLMPTIAEEDVAGVVTSIKDVLAGQGGSGFLDGFPTKRSLAYEMRRETAGGRTRVNQGYFGWVKFQCARARVEALAQELKKDERIVRFLFVHAPKEVVALPPKRLRSSLLRRPLGDKLLKSAEETAGISAPVVPAMTDEELDRTIEELIIE